MGKRYEKLLSDPRWKARSLEIMKRDRFSCKKCGSSSVRLNVHHILYRKEFIPPWDYDDDELITLCEKCHKLIHDEIDDFSINIVNCPPKRWSGRKNVKKNTCNDCDEKDALIEQLTQYNNFLNQEIKSSSEAKYLEMIKRIWPFIYEDIHCDDITPKYKDLIYDVADLLGKDLQRRFN